MPSLAILLTSFNGEKFILQQLSSIQLQTFNNWKLFISDDGSTDKTIDIARAFAATDSRITIIDSKSVYRGPARNFSDLAAACSESADLFFFCDQDDIWEPSKLSTFVSFYEDAIRKKIISPDNPVLVHSDLSLIDKYGTLFEKSFWSYQQLHLKQDSFACLLVQNTVTGCAMMANKALIRHAGVVPPEAIMHDWWYALVAAGTGSVLRIPEPLTRYRQHSSNSVGAKKAGLSALVSGNLSLGRIVNTVTLALKQAKAAQDIFGAQLPEIHRSELALVCSFYDKPSLTRMLKMYLKGIRKIGIFRNIGFLVGLLLIWKNRDIYAE